MYYFEIGENFSETLIYSGLGAVPNSVRWELNSGSSTHLNESNTNNSSTLQNVAHNKPEPLSVDMAKFGERTDMRESQKSLHALLKPEIEKLCEILQLPVCILSPYSRN